MFFINHLILPLVLYFVINGLLFGWKNWRTFLLMCLAFFIDLDHLFANPVFDAERCSIGFHPLHQPIVIIGLIVLPMLFQLWPLIIGILIHLILDIKDCAF